MMEKIQPQTQFRIFVVLFYWQIQNNCFEAQTLPFSAILRQEWFSHFFYPKFPSVISNLLYVIYLGINPPDLLLPKWHFVVLNLDCRISNELSRIVNIKSFFLYDLFQLMIQKLRLFLSSSTTIGYYRSSRDFKKLFIDFGN